MLEELKFHRYKDAEEMESKRPQVAVPLGIEVIFMSSYAYKFRDTVVVGYLESFSLSR